MFPNIHTMYCVETRGSLDLHSTLGAALEDYYRQPSILNKRLVHVTVSVISNQSNSVLSAVEQVLNDFDWGKTSLISEEGMYHAFTLRQYISPHTSISNRFEDAS